MSQHEMFGGRDNEQENHDFGVPRAVATMLLSSALAVLWAHGLGSITSHFTESLVIAAWPTTIAATLGAVITSWLSLYRSVRIGVIAAVIFACICILTVNIINPGEWSRTLPLVLLLPAAAYFSPWFASQIPTTFDAEATKSKERAVLLLILALLTLTQVARLTSYMADTDKGLFIMTDRRGPLHECLGSYLYAAEMNMRGEENIYDSSLYKGWNRRAETNSEIRGIPNPDAYFYPPPFLLLPQAAISLTKDMAVIRLMWLAIQATLIVGVALSLAVWIGGRAGGYAATLFPLALISVPTLNALHYGQFHFATVALAVGGMLAFAKNRKFLGAGMLGFAVVSKIFPLVLLIGLAVRKKWVELAYAVSAIVVITGVAYLIVGPQAFKMFFIDMLPRLSDGSLTQLKINEPHEIGMRITANQGFFGIIRKLVALDVLNISFQTALMIAKGISLLVVAAALFGYSKKAKNREGIAVAWIALVGIASLAGTIALGGYVPVTLLWLATFLAYRMTTSTTIKILVVLCWLTTFIPFTGEPILGFVKNPLFTWISLASALVMVTTFLTSLFQRSGQRLIDRQQESVT